MEDNCGRLRLRSPSGHHRCFPSHNPAGTAFCRSLDTGHHKCCHIHVCVFSDIALRSGKTEEDVEQNETAHIFAHTFGNFDLFVDGKAVCFERARSRELLAYLIDRQGVQVNRKTIFSTIWEDAMYDRSMQKQLDVVIRSLKSTLEEYGVSEILEMRNGMLRVVPEKFECDLYRFFAGDADVINSFHGEYMSDYSWASVTEAYMDRF